jgi:putative transposase
MSEFQHLSHTVWECKYHVVWIPKYRRKELYGELRRHLGTIRTELAVQKESRILEGHLMLDHIHMLVSIPPKYLRIHQEAGTRRPKTKSIQRV